LKRSVYTVKLAAGDRLDVSATDKIVGRIELIFGLLLFVFVVVPLGLFGKVVRRWQ